MNGYQTDTNHVAVQHCFIPDCVKDSLFMFTYVYDLWFIKFSLWFWALIEIVSYYIHILGE